MRSAILLMALIGSNLASAQKLQTAYFKGLQPVGIAGDTVECLVEATFAARKDRVKIRSLVADSHDQDKTVGYGPVVAIYNPKRLGYVYAAKKADKELRGLFLSSASVRTAQGLSLEISHGHHTDSILCNDLSALDGADLAVAIKKFEHFEDFVEDGDHDHGHQHGHKHKHR
jgi:hypothetical protein